MAETVELRQIKKIIGMVRRGGGIAILSGEVRMKAKKDRILTGARTIPEMELSCELGMPQPAITSAVQPEEL